MAHVTSFQRLQPVLLALAGVVAALILFAACGRGEDRPGSVQVDPESETVSISGTGTGTGTHTGTGTGTGTGASTGTGTRTGAMGDYEPVSNVQAHARVTLDVGVINRLLGSAPYDYAAIQAVYEDGKNSVNSDGSIRTLSGFARNGGRSEPIWDDYTAYYGDQTWLDTFVMAAIQGTGPFAGEPDAVRRQGIQKGIQNQVMIAWVLHELVGAIGKAEAGNFDPASGAPHNWDEAWAFYHGVDPENGPFATANKRGANFGRGTAANDEILREMIEGRDALVEGNANKAEEEFEEIVEQIKVTYLQAAIRYAQKVSDAVHAGDLGKARVEQAEGWSFYRVIEPLVAKADADVARTVARYFDLANQPAASAGPEVLRALESAYGALGVDAEDVGSLGS